jgi:hypothetical protein
MTTKPAPGLRRFTVQVRFSAVLSYAIDAPSAEEAQDYDLYNLDPVYIDSAGAIARNSGFHLDADWPDSVAYESICATETPDADDPVATIQPDEDGEE